MNLLRSECVTIRSYTYEDRNSDAHIDIDLIAQLETEGKYSYLVAIFGRFATEPRSNDDGHSFDPRS
jgi:hypothetical protein